MKVNETGRSMIEMLGVLAIIGVLSVGGIAGYTKAMTQYKINKTIDQVTQLAQNIRAYYATQKDYESLSDTVIKKAHLAPEEMWNSSEYLENPFGGMVWIEARGKYSLWEDSKAFAIHLHDLPEEACIELLTQDWGVGSSSGLIAVGHGAYAYFANLGTGDFSSRPDYHNSGFVTFASEGVMGLDKATTICSTPGDIVLKFY